MRYLITDSHTYTVHKRHIIMYHHLLTIGRSIEKKVVLFRKARKV
jgi:hypothetical protein